jgi:phosphocarrier protein HPr
MGLLSRKTTSNQDQTAAKEFTILNRLGLHARPSAMFVKAANRFKAEVWVEKDGEQVNGKSIMGLMMLAAGQGSKLIVTCEGGDAEQALAEIESLIQRRFDEE